MSAGSGVSIRLLIVGETVLVPVLAILVSLLVFGVFIAVSGHDAVSAYRFMYVGAFGSWFSWQNTLQRAAPLLLTALCTALPAQMGLVIIGGEGAFVAGGLMAVTVGLPMADAGVPPLAAQFGMAMAGMIAGAATIALAGGLRHWRGVNETISSLFIGYVMIAVMNQLVEGVMRDPTSLNKPSTRALPDAYMLGNLPGLNVHVGLVFGLAACVLAYVLMAHTTFGFAARIVGGNPRAARMAGLPVGRLVMVVCALGGAAAGLGGMVELAAVQGRVNADLAAGYGLTGVLVAFLARQNPLAIIPVAVLLGGIGASGGMLQRRLGLPESAVLVLQGILFVVLLASQGFSVRVLPRGFFRRNRLARASPPSTPATQASP